MAIKGIFLPNRIPVNKFSLNIQPGIGTPVFVSVGEFSPELDSVDLPDRTARSGGRVKPIEFDVVQPMHHDIEVKLMELWYNLCKNTLPGYLKLGIFILFDEYGIPHRKTTLPNLWISGKKSSGGDIDNDGDMATITWTMKADDALPML